jgi:hypothetical protein
MKKPAHHLIAEVPSNQSKVEMTIGIDLGDVWSHYWVFGRGAVSPVKEILNSASQELGTFISEVSSSSVRTISSGHKERIRPFDGGTSSGSPRR